MGQFGIGQSVTRFEDPRLLKGKGRYLDDINLPDQARGYVLRSPYAHARIISIDVEAARRAPGVLAVYTGEDFESSGKLLFESNEIPKIPDEPDYADGIRVLLQGEF